jgi:hypothetical protein
MSTTVESLHLEDIAMANAGLSTEIIVMKMNSSTTDFDTLDDRKYESRFALNIMPVLGPESAPSSPTAMLARDATPDEALLAVIAMPTFVLG